MKTIVSIQDISEFDIKPELALEEWRSLVKKEIVSRWSDRSGWINSPCPFCSKNDSNPAFESYGISYVECKDCGSLFAPERPAEEELWSWYRESIPAKYWRERLLPDCEQVRFDKMISPRANWILDSIAEYKPLSKRLVDVSHNGRGLDNLLAIGNDKLEEIISAGMTADLEGISHNRIIVLPTKTADLINHGSGTVDIIVAIDTFDRFVDINKLVETFHTMLSPGGLIFATAVVSSGFEIQTLWDKSPSVIPPDKLNLPSVDGLKKLFPKSNWEILELSTPGMFDIEMVSRVMQSNPSYSWPRVVRMLVQNLDSDGRMSMIELLQSLSLTSFARIIVRKINKTN